MKCPTCKGAKKITVPVTSVTSKGKEESSFEMPCHICGGKGEVTAKENEIHKMALAAWCDCGNPSGETKFYDDNEHPDCRKHHYRCCDCHKIVQIG